MAFLDILAVPNLQRELSLGVKNIQRIYITWCPGFFRNISHEGFSEFPLSIGLQIFRNIVTKADNNFSLADWLPNVHHNPYYLGFVIPFPDCGCGGSVIALGSALMTILNGRFD